MCSCIFSIPSPSPNEKKDYAKSLSSAGGNGARFDFATLLVSAGENFIHIYIQFRVKKICLSMPGTVRN